LSVYRTLDSLRTVNTIFALKTRIEERFPSSGLSRVCDELHQIANETKNKSDWIGRPNYVLRVGVTAVVLIGLVGLFYSISFMGLTLRSLDAGELVQITEAGLNDIVLIGAAIFFLVTVETRVKRSRALSALHELRSIAHVIDMHQLTKDPSILLTQAILTPSSPKRELSAFELVRYLDYCSEMLSLTGKIAALYAQNFKDSVVLAAVNEVESLTTGLSRKIWQKIVILNELCDKVEISSNHNLQSGVREAHG